MMDDLKLAALAFQRLLDVKYKIVLGKKGKLSEFCINFDKNDFFHLIGLQYLKDIPQLKTSRSRVFDLIIEEKITQQSIAKSAFYNKISQRIKDFTLLEAVLDSNNLIFKYSKKRSTFSEITAEYLLKTIYENRTNYIFIDNSNQRKYKFCRSFFFNDTNDYTSNQITMTLLYKEKIYSSGKSIIQLDKLNIRN